MSIRNSVLDIVMKTADRVHRALITVTNGRVGSEFRRLPIVDLHTTGRTSGERRSTILMAPLQDGPRLVLVASRGGDSRHPHWYLNLVAEPKVEITFRGETRPMTARPATPEERAQLWPRIVEAFAGYGQYQKRTDREIPVVICEPREQ
jgi:deazaflavin-dependent oxidoreductase (nitroreductase family)